MSAQALANGIYLRPLSKRETVAVMVGTLMEFFEQRGNEQMHIANGQPGTRTPPDAYRAMLHMRAAHFNPYKRLFTSRYPTPNDIPIDQRPLYIALDRDIRFWTARMKAIGWIEPDEAADARYEQVVRRAGTGQ